MSDSGIETYLKSILQRNVKFVVNNKVLKEGRVVVYNLKDFYISFILNTKKNQNKTYEIPRPFKVTSQDKCLFFDYSISLVAKTKKSNTLIGSISKNIGKKSKLFDSTLTIECE